MSALQHALADLVSAYHVLHNEKILQEYGSISVRNPENPDTFFTSCVPAILVSFRNHLVEYNVSDGSYVRPPGVSGVLHDLDAHTVEPYVHSCIYDRFPEVQSIVHSQAMNGIIYGLCDAGGSMIMPVYNKAGFAGNYNPIFDPAKYYDRLPETHPQDLRISHKLLGDNMANLLQEDVLDGEVKKRRPDYSCVLLRGNGVALWNDSIPGAVHKAIHLRRNTIIQTAAMLQRAHSDLEVTYLNPREAAESEASTISSLRVIWAGWLAEVEGQSRYHNNVRLDKNPFG